MGLGSIALGSLLGRDSARANGVNPFLPGKPHFTPKAKNVIYLFMGGGPSQLELYDWKPELAKRHGGDIPDEFVKGKRFAFMNSTFKQNNKLLGPVKKFSQHGQSGMWFSENIPNIAGIADEITMFRTCKTNLFNHAPAKLFMNTGTGIFGRPSMGSWVTYGIGSESQSLPGFVVLHSGPRGPRGVRPTGPAVFCRPLIRVFRCAARATPSSISPARPGSIPLGNAVPSTSSISST